MKKNTEPQFADEAEANNAIATASTIAAIDARTLMKSRNEALLVLDGEQYRLRITVNNKLILTK